MTETLLPPNATSLERAAARTTGRIDALPTPLRDIWNPDDCPADLLPWLAYAFGVEDWSASWTEQQRRAVIEQSIVVKRYRGTIGAVQLAINALGMTCRVKEWFRQIPAGAPYTYRLLIEVTQTGYSLAQLRQMLSIVDRTKNLRSHLDQVELSVKTQAKPAVAACAGIGTEISLTNYVWATVVFNETTICM